MRSPPSRRRPARIAAPFRRGVVAMAASLLMIATSFLIGCDSSRDPADATFAPAAAPTSAKRPSDPFGEPLVLMKFGATWCGPCRRVDRELDRLAGTVTGLEIVRVDVDERPDLAKRFDVSGIPHLVLVRGGETLDTHVGYRSAEDLQRWAARFGRLGPAPEPTQNPAGGTREVKPGEVHSNPFANLLGTPR